jgi:radical SAM superfamily enzyme YgiQ (UPF0313 family)
MIKEKVKVLLIQPKILSKGIQRQYPIGIASISAYCSKYSNAQIKVFDQQFDRKQNLINILVSFNPDLVGISIVSKAFINAINISKEIKEYNDQIIIIAGGPHPTVLPELTLNSGKFDIVVRGEGEITFLELLQKVKSNGNLLTVKGISFINSIGQFIHNPDRPLLHDIEKIPIPFCDLPINDYTIMNVMSSRGCLRKCSFCANSTKKSKIRYRLPETFVNEISFWNRNFGIKEFYFPDDLFTSDKRRVKRICEQILKKKLNIVWAAQSRV